MPILTLLIALPIVGSLALLAVPNRDGSNDQTMRLGALAISLVTLVASLFMWAGFDSSAAAPPSSSSNATTGSRPSASSTPSASTASA